MDFARRPVAQRLVGTLLVVEPEVGRQARLQFGDSLIILNVNVFVFHAPPEPFHEHVVQRTPPTVPAHRDPGRLQPAGVLREVNCEPWSVLKTSGRPRSNASSNASRQNRTSSGFDSRHDST